MLIDNCVASEPHLLLLRIEQFVMARLAKLCNRCKSDEKLKKKTNLIIHDIPRACTNSFFFFANKAEC